MTGSLWSHDLLELRRCLLKIEGWGFPCGPVIKNPPCNARETGLSPGLGRFHMSQATKTWAPQPLSLCSWVHEPATTELATSEPLCSNFCSPRAYRLCPAQRSHGDGEPVHRRGEQPRLPETRESRAQQQRPSANKNKYAQSCSRVQLLTTPWAVARQASLSMGFSRQEYWNGLPCPSPEDLPNPGMELKSLSSPASSGGFFTTAPPRINKNK